MKKDHYEVQMLMGIPMQKCQDDLIKNGILARLYVSSVEKWSFATAYCKRRLAVNPAMAAYIVKSLFQKGIGKK